LERMAVMAVMAVAVSVVAGMTMAVVLTPPPL
jgi:hypothetical protein